MGTNPVVPSAQTTFLRQEPACPAGNFHQFCDTIQSYG